MQHRLQRFPKLSRERHWAYFLHSRFKVVSPTMPTGEVVVVRMKNKGLTSQPSQSGSTVDTYWWMAACTEVPFSRGKHYNRRCPELQKKLVIIGVLENKIIPPSSDDSAQIAQPGERGQFSCAHSPREIGYFVQFCPTFRPQARLFSTIARKEGEGGLQNQNKKDGGAS